MNDNDEYLLTPEGVTEPETEAFYAYGFDNAVTLLAEKIAQTGKGWKLYQRVPAKAD